MALGGYYFYLGWGFLAPWVARFDPGCSALEVGWVLGERLAMRPTMAMPFGRRFPLWRHVSMHLAILLSWIFWVKT
jgi:hypothetical protein